MTPTDQAPLVRNRHGVILGVDWRRVPGMARPGVTVPGVIPVWAVMPGDRIRVDGDLVTVCRATPSPSQVGVVHIVTVTDGEADVVIERHRDDRVDVVEAGVFG